MDYSELQELSKYVEKGKLAEMFMTFIEDLIKDMEKQLFNEWKEADVEKWDDIRAKIFAIDQLKKTLEGMINDGIYAKKIIEQKLKEEENYGSN